MILKALKPQPKFNVGDRCVFVYPVAFGKGRKVLSVIEDDMTIADNPIWNEYRGGEWYYPIVDKANECPERELRLYTGQEEGDIVE